MGRPRKKGARFPCGKLKPEHSADTSANRIQYASSLGKPLNMGTVQAVLFKHRKLSESQWRAADWYQDRYAEYQRALQAPGKPRESVSGGFGYTDEEEAQKRLSKLVRRFERLRGLLDTAQKEALNMIELQVFDFRKESALVDALNVVHKFRS